MLENSPVWTFTAVVPDFGKSSQANVRDLSERFWTPASRCPE